MLLLAEEDVFGGAQRRNQRQLLREGNDAQLVRFLHRAYAAAHAVNLDMAGIGANHARQHRDQGRLAGTALTEQRVNRAVRIVSWMSSTTVVGP